MTSLRVLVVSKGSPITERLEGVGHHVTPVDECDVAVEALQFQTFDAVVLGSDVPLLGLEALAQEIQQLNRQSSVRTALLGVASEEPQQQGMVGLDGYLPAHGTPEALAAALVNLAVRSPTLEGPDATRANLAVLNALQLQEHLDFDSDLLFELIGLFISERQRQSPEMREALTNGDFAGLSRIAHTIKGSLGSLEAPSARADAQLLETAAISENRAVCEQLLPGFEGKLDELQAELEALGRTVANGR